MYHNITKMKTELFINIAWLGTNTTLAVITLNQIAIAVTIISGLIFVGYNISRWYQQILETRKFKKDNEDL